MPLKLNVGISKKIGQPDYGSLGASCHVEVELDSSLLFDDVEAFQDRITNAYAACRQAVEGELAQHDSSIGRHTTAGKAASRKTNREQDAPTQGHRASQKQLDYAQQLAGQIRGLGARRVADLAQRMFDKPLVDLSSLDASGLIDALKQIKAGKIDCKAALGEIAA